MKMFLTALISLAFGLVFGLGLVISGMVDPVNVIGFLDLTGSWRPALALVMGGAIIVALPLFWLARKRGKSLIGDTLETPPKGVDARLLAGSAIFGIGWGLSGICPGPGLVWLGIDPLKAAPFMISVLIGSFLADQFRKTSAK